MRQFTWALTTLFLVFTWYTSAECKSLVVKRHAEIDPVATHDQDLFSDPRDKRHGKVDAVYGVKNAILGFVFNNPANRPSRSILDGFAWEKPTTVKTPTTTDDVVIFEKDQKVSLDVPGELFGSSFTLVTNISQTVGDLLINSAVRTQRLLESMRPFLRWVFGAKGLVIEGPTDKPIFSDPGTNAV